jgi:aldehyde dehydrogenase (NAD+)
MKIDFELHERMAKQVLPDVRLLIGDEWLASGAGGEFTHVNAATGRPQATVPLAGAEEVDAAVKAARAALPGWLDQRPDQRRNALFRLAALIRERAETIGQVLTLECGSPISGATALPMRAADYLEYYGGLADKIEGTVVSIFPERAFDYTLPEPYGVIALVSTWNGGISSLARKAGAALAAGNTVVAKAMELAPFSAVLFGELALEAGFPPGVVNILPGGVEAGQALVAHPGVDKISFTGGIDAARQILAAAAWNITPAIVELGGKSGNLVFPDADLAAAGAFAGVACMRNSGQGCVMPTRLIVHESIHDQIVERALASIAAMPVGDSLDPATAFGPVVSERHANRIVGMVDSAREAGVGEILTGGGRLDVEGFYVEPTVIDRIAPDAPLAQEEVFGPVLSILTFETEEEAIALANGVRYGLAGYVHTTDLDRAHRVASALNAGYVSLNGFAALPAGAPFGGFGASGYGKEGGRDGLAEFVRTKNVYLPLR